VGVVASLKGAAVLFHEAPVHEQLSFVEDAAAAAVQGGIAEGVVGLSVSADDKQVLKVDDGTAGNLEDARGIVAVDRDRLLPRASMVTSWFRNSSPCRSTM
jgi:hypothetical protein